MARFVDGARAFCLDLSEKLCHAFVVMLQSSLKYLSNICDKFTFPFIVN